MSRTLLIAVVAVALVGLGALAYTQLGSADKGGTVSWVSFDEGMSKARAEKKKVVLDVYTDWCSWCKKMDAEVYADPVVAKLLREKFVVIKLNAEASSSLSYDSTSYTNAEFSQALGVTGYPATVFFAEDARPITLLPGYVDAERFATILRYIGEDHYRTVSFDDYLAKASQIP